MKNKIFVTILMLWAVVVHGQLALAQSLSVVQDLDFGEAVVTNNSDQHMVDIMPDGTFAADPEYIFLQDPARGIYHVVGLPPSTAITNITINVLQQMEGPGEDFTISNFNIDAPSSSDGDGELTIDLGARMQTSGSSQTYFPNSSFASILEITIQY